VIRAALCLALLAAACASAQTRSDHAREKRWADQVVPNLVVGEAVYLEAPGAPRFLALYARAAGEKAAVILAHGPGLHPDHGITGELRMHLVDAGYTTLSLQMPVLGAEDEGGAEYAKLFPEAAQRIAAGMRYLQAGGARRVAIVSHAMGSGMAYRYLSENRGAPVFAWAALSFYGVFKDLAGVPFPVLDLYGAADYRGIRGPAEERRRVLQSIPGSRQSAVADGGRFLAGGEKTVLQEVRAFLDTALVRK
jgi:hypothetical protein